VQPNLGIAPEGFLWQWIARSGPLNDLDRVVLAAPPTPNDLDDVFVHLLAVNRGLTGKVKVPELSGLLSPDDVKTRQVAAVGAAPAVVRVRYRLSHGREPIEPSRADCQTPALASLS